MKFILSSLAKSSESTMPVRFTSFSSNKLCLLLLNGLRIVSKYFKSNFSLSLPQVSSTRLSIVRLYTLWQLVGSCDSKPLNSTIE